MTDAIFRQSFLCSAIIRLAVGIVVAGLIDSSFALASEPLDIRLFVKPEEGEISEAIDGGLIRPGSSIKLRVGAQGPVDIEIRYSEPNTTPSLVGSVTLGEGQDAYLPGHDEWFELKGPEGAYQFEVSSVSPGELASQTFSFYVVSDDLFRVALPREQFQPGTNQIVVSDEGEAPVWTWDSPQTDPQTDRALSTQIQELLADQGLLPVQLPPFRQDRVKGAKSHSQMLALAGKVGSITDLRGSGVELYKAGVVP